MSKEQGLREKIVTRLMAKRHLSKNEANIEASYFIALLEQRLDRLKVLSDEEIGKAWYENPPYGSEGVAQAQLDDIKRQWKEAL